MEKPKMMTRTHASRLYGTRWLLPIAAVLLLASPAWAVYDSGSDGSLGDLNLTADQKEVEIQLPPDGVLHYKTISIAAGVTLKLKRNAENTPAVLLASGDVLIEGTIDVSGTEAQKCSDTPPKKPFTWCAGQGGPGGFNSGFEKQGGGGPGGSTGQPNGGLVSGPNKYGDPSWINLAGGSGGARPAFSGSSIGGGGGAITIASNTTILLNGKILANAGSNSGGGGKVRLVAETVGGTGTAEAKGSIAGLVKFEAFLFSGTLSNNSNPAPYLGTPQVAIPYPATERPKVIISKIDGQAPVGTLGQFPPNITLTREKVLKVELTTQFIPIDTVLKVRVVPNLHTTSVIVVDSVPVSGTYENGKATAEFTIAAGVGLGTIEAWAPSIPIPTQGE